MSTDTTMTAATKPYGSRAQAVVGTFELHVFVGPLAPDADTVRRFREACAAHGPAAGESDRSRRLKGLLLGLDYQQHGFVEVMQTSRYIRGSLADAWREIQCDATALRRAGFDVLREKVEAVASNDHVPAHTDDVGRIPLDGYEHPYFEFHLRVIRAGAAPDLDHDDKVTLRALAAQLAQIHDRLIPLSYNADKPDRWFLNARTYGLGRSESYELVQALADAVAATDTLRVDKVIREYIVGDSHRALDQGWLEPLPA